MPGAESHAARALSLLAARGESLATAESLTGGLVCAALTDVPGSSAVVRGAVVAYAVPVKVGVLGVPTQVVSEEGPGVVSRQCALAMAAGVCEALDADWGLATTGVAGPGPADGHPAGTVHVAVVRRAESRGEGDLGGEHARGRAREHRGAHRALSLHGSREEVRAGSVVGVLDLLVQTLEGLSEGPRSLESRTGAEGPGARTRRDDHGAAAPRDRGRAAGGPPVPGPDPA